MRIRNVSLIALVVLCGSLLRAQKAGFLDLVQNGSPADVQAAIAKGADVNAKDDNGATPLLLAAQTNGNPDVIKVLAKAGADLNAKDANGCTPLVGNLENTKPNAASLDSAPLPIPALLKKGADAKVADKSGKRAVDCAKQNAKLNGSPALQQLIDAS
jgi:uncharacterized protein